MLEPGIGKLPGKIEFAIGASFEGSGKLNQVIGEFSFDARRYLRLEKFAKCKTCQKECQKY